MDATAKTARIQLTRRSPGYWRVVCNNSPLDGLGPEILDFQAIMSEIETDEQVELVVFAGAVEGVEMDRTIRYQIANFCS